MTSVIIETVLATLASVIIAYLGYRVYSLKQINHQLISDLLQQSVDRNAIASKLEETVTMVNNTSVEDKDGFIKFLSQSREWAFDYIEKVQAAIKVLHVAMNSGDEVAIATAYNELTKFLPDEQENIS